MNLSPFKKYKFLLGFPKKGIHSYRILDTAIIDYLLTILLAIIISYISNIPLVLTTILCFILGIIIHLLFGIETNTLKFLGIL